MPIVYRMEHAKGKHGPFVTRYHEDRRAGGDKLRGIYYSLSPTYFTHPDPASDGLVDELTKGWAFGCPSRPMVQYWFMDARVELHQEGYVLRIYFIPKNLLTVSISGKQVAFDKIKAQLIKEELLSEQTNLTPVRLTDLLKERNLL